MKNYYIFGVVVITLIVIIVGEYLSNKYSVVKVNFGINDSVCDVLSEYSYDNLNTLLDGKLDGYYSIVSDKKIKKKYPNLRGNNGYVLNTKMSNELIKEVKFHQAFLYKLSVSNIMEDLGYSIDSFTLKYYLYNVSNNDVKKIYSDLYEINDKEIDKLAYLYKFSELDRLKFDKDKNRKNYIIKHLVFVIVIYCLLLLLCVMINSSNNSYLSMALFLFALLLNNKVIFVISFILGILLTVLKFSLKIKQCKIIVLLFNFISDLLLLMYSNSYILTLAFFVSFFLLLVSDDLQVRYNARNMS